MNFDNPQHTAFRKRAGCDHLLPRSTREPELGMAAATEQQLMEAFKLFDTDVRRRGALGRHV